MTVAELIEQLKQMPQNAQVAVKYRDDGGSYYGCDYDVEPFVNDIPKNKEGVEIGTVLL